MPISGFFILIFLSAIFSILFLYYKSIIILLCFIALVIFAYKKYHILHSFLLIICFIFFQFYKVNNIVNIEKKNNVTLNAKVYVVEEKYALVKSDNINYLIYYDSSKLTLNEDNTIMIKGDIKQIEKSLDIDVFDFSTYLKNKRVFYQIEYSEITIIDNSLKFSHKIVSSLLKNLKDESYMMSKMLIFNDSSANLQAYESLKEIQAIHLFVVSGFHISFLFKLISKLFGFNKKLATIISFVFCLFYIFLLDFSISATRAFLSLFLSVFANKYLNRLDFVTIPGILFLLIEPLNIFNYSFIMTFVMTITIILTSNALKNNNKIINSLIIALVCFLATVPFQLLLSYKINFIALLSNFILTYVVMVIFILCILGIILSFINGNIFGFIYQYFNNLTSTLSSFNTSITFGCLKIWMVLLFYFLIFLFIFFLEKLNFKKLSLIAFLFVMFFVCLYNRQSFVFYQQVTFLNVYQGDCTIIQDSYNGKVLLIDTGGLKNYDIASKKIMPYLNYHGIRKIDIVVITHNDYDHNGALESLKKQIEIKEIISDYNIDTINLGKITLTNINHYATSDSEDNDKSIVLYGNICSLNFLFTGDMSKKIEKQIINDYDTLPVDVLKVAHHGSKTASSDEFISFISPTYGIISVAKNNSYGLPNKVVIDTLNKYDVTIYRIDENGTVRIKGKIFDKYFIETAK